ncbi:MAG: MFS transporter [Phycisphaerae bacterium]|nr:MFS transporter [Phycisphaerae bacterium]
MNQNNTDLKKQIIIFFAAAFFFAIGGSVYETIFSNFLNDVCKISDTGRGWLELPRELPGLAVVFMTGLLAAISMNRLGVLSILIYIAGVLGLMFVEPVYGIIVFLMMVVSTGQHLIMPIQSTIALSLGQEHNRGRRVSQTRLVQSMGNIVGAGFVAVYFAKNPIDHTNAITKDFHPAFIFSIIAAFVGAIFYFKLHIPELKKKRAKPILRKKYSLYYCLEFLFGARKQIFLTFGPWVLIRHFERNVSEIASLYLIASIIGFITKPIIGYSIDKLGEKKVLITDAILLIVVCLGYGYSEQIAVNFGYAKYGYVIASACYVLDHLLFDFGAARNTYLSKIIHSRDELSGTLATGVSVNHVASMALPPIAGFIWATLGFTNLFTIAAFLALFIVFAATKIPNKAKLDELAKA